MNNRKSIDKVVKLLDLIDKNIREENCWHDPAELLQEYEKINNCLNRRGGGLIVEQVVPIPIRM